MAMAGGSRKNKHKICALAAQSWTKLIKVEQSFVMLSKIEQSWATFDIGQIWTNQTNVEVEKNWEKLSKDEQNWLKLNNVEHSQTKLSNIEKSWKMFTKVEQS